MELFIGSRPRRRLLRYSLHEFVAAEGTVACRCRAPNQRPARLRPHFTLNPTPAEIRDPALSSWLWISGPKPPVSVLFRVPHVVPPVESNVRRRSRVRSGTLRRGCHFVNHTDVPCDLTTRLGHTTGVRPSHGRVPAPPEVGRDPRCTCRPTCCADNLKCLQKNCAFCGVQAAAVRQSSVSSSDRARRRCTRSSETGVDRYK